MWLHLNKGEYYNLNLATSIGLTHGGHGGVAIEFNEDITIEIDGRKAEDFRKVCESNKLFDNAYTVLDLSKVKEEKSA